MRHKSIILFVVSWTSLLVSAQEPIPTQKGFHGYLNLNIGYLRFRNNQIAQFMSYKLNDKEISSIYGVPEAQNNVLFTFPLEFGYTFIPYKTHVFIGNQLEDLIRFDVTQQLGIKQRLWWTGVLQAGLLYTSLPTKVWEDPFLSNAERVPSNRTAFGVLLAWDQIFNSGFRIEYSYRDVVVKNERSGDSLELSDSERGLLRRNGDMHSLKIQYRFYFSDRFRLVPAFTIVRDKREGAAISRTTYDFTVNYILHEKNYSVVANGRIGVANYDDVNPIYQVKNREMRYGLTGAYYIANPMGWKLFGDKPFRFVFSAAYYYIDTQIEFYQQRGLIAQVGIITRW